MRMDKAHPPERPVERLCFSDVRFTTGMRQAATAVAPQRLYL